MRARKYSKKRRHFCSSHYKELIDVCETVNLAVTRVVMHFDLDYFFAQCEERENPDLKEKPLVVCVYSGRTEDSGAELVVPVRVFCKKGKGKG